jgi:hypothetical protein
MTLKLLLNPGFLMELCPTHRKDLLSEINGEVLDIQVSETRLEVKKTTCFVQLLNNLK